jgi:hypothetical protein
VLVFGSVVRLLGEVPTIIPPLAQKKEHCFRHSILLFRGQFPHVCDNFLKLLRHMQRIPHRYAVTSAETDALATSFCSAYLHHTARERNEVSSRS